MLTLLLVMSLFCCPCIHTSMAKTCTQTTWSEEKNSYEDFFETPEESLSQKESWEHFKQEIALDASKIPGWCAEEKALFIMDFFKGKQISRY